MYINAEDLEEMIFSYLKHHSANCSNPELLSDVIYIFLFLPGILDDFKGDYNRFCISEILKRKYLTKEEKQK